jgi:hypothetical protein
MGEGNGSTVFTRFLLEARRSIASPDISQPHFYTTHAIKKRLSKHKSDLSPKARESGLLIALGFQKCLH